MTSSLLSPTDTHTTSPLLSSTPSSSTSSSKRPGSTPSHPWRFKKTKTKAKPNQIVTKSVCLLDAPPDEFDDGCCTIPDYSLVDDMIILKGYCDLGTSYSEADIRKEISEILQQKFPAITTGLFDFVKRERNRVVTPVVKATHKWDFKQVKELCGQGKLYVRLNVPREALEITADEPSTQGEEVPVERVNITGTPDVQISQSMSHRSDQEQAPSYSNRTQMHDLANHSSPVQVGHSQIPPNNNVIVDDSLQEMLPGTSAETIADAFQRHGGDINSTLDSLLEPAKDENLEKPTCLSEILPKLKEKMKTRPAKLTVDVNDLFNDAISFYKNSEFNPEQPLRVTFDEQPAIDGGGVLRQFYTDLFSIFVDEKMMFVGEYNRKCPTHSPQMVFSGLLEIVGKIIAHSIAQGGPGFPFLSLPCYYYLATGDVISAMAYCDPWDVPDFESRQCILKVNLVANHT
jgi:hypothetical protein